MVILEKESICFINGGEMFENFKEITSDHMWKFGIIMLVLLSIGDMVSTYYALKMGHFEGNPLPRYVIENLGWIVACVIKAFQIGFICWILRVAYRKSQVATLATLWFIVGISFMTVAGNIAIINSYWM